MGRQIARVEEDDEASPAKEPGIVRKLQRTGHRLLRRTDRQFAVAGVDRGDDAGEDHPGDLRRGAEAGDGKKYPYHYQIMFNTDQQAEISRRLPGRELG